MSRLLKKALLVFLLGWVPLQASAYPLIALLCERDPGHGHAAVHGQHAQIGGDSEQDQSGDRTGDGSSHLPVHNCCHNLGSAAVPAVTVASAAAVTGVEPTPNFHLVDFFPDQPKRPPLAA